MAQEKRKPHTHHFKKRSNKPQTGGFCAFMKTALLEGWFLLHALIDYIVDFCFGLYYKDEHRKFVPPIKESFLKESAFFLAEKIKKKELTSEQIVQACIDRIGEVNSTINAVVDNRFEAALEEARSVDKFIASGPLSAEEIRRKPFLGVPFTTKESTACKGLKYSLGLVSRKNVKATEDAEVVELLKKAGGILIANTNIPVMNLWCETGNNVYGYTNNPYNTTRTVGGSSGGEAALITSCGSPLGIGTDIGGSIRMPAFFCGIFGHKPTTGLISLRGLTRRTGNEGPTMVCAGPLSRYAEDLAPMLKVLLGDNISSLPKLDAEISMVDIKFFYLESSRDVRASRVNGDMQRALNRAVEHLSGAGGQPAQRLPLPEFQYSFRLWRYWQAREPGPGLAAELTDRKGHANAWIEIFKKITGQSDLTLAPILKLFDMKLPQEKPKWAEAATESLRKQLLEALGENGVLLFPSHPFPASYHYSSYFRPYNFGYWGIFNVLNLPVTQVPMGLSSAGLPVGIQVVAAPYQDHLCLAVARELQEVFGGWVPPYQV